MTIVQAVEEATCVHHWVVESPDGRRELPGKCKKCGLERLFEPGLVMDVKSHHWKKDMVDKARRVPRVLRVGRAKGVVPSVARASK